MDNTLAEEVRLLTSNSTDNALVQEVRLLTRKNQHERKGHRWKTHIVLFTDSNHKTDFVHCFEDQLDEIYELLISHNVLIVHAYKLGRTEFRYNKNTQE